MEKDNKATVRWKSSDGQSSVFFFFVITKGDCPVDSMYRKVFVLHMPM